MKERKKSEFDYSKFHDKSRYAPEIIFRISPHFDIRKIKETIVKMGYRITGGGCRPYTAKRIKDFNNE